MDITNALRIGAGDRDLWVAVEGTTARMELHDRAGDQADDQADNQADDQADDQAGDRAGEPVRIEVPARALVAALRAAWAQEHHRRCFEPWLDAVHRRWGRELPDDSPYPDPLDDPDRPDFYDDYHDELGDGDPYGYGDDPVPPVRFPPPAPRPARSGRPWEAHEEQTLYSAWLAADPQAHRDTVVREIAARLDRGPGGITLRLPKVGCDPARPGALLERPSSTPAPGADDTRDAPRLSLVPSGP